MIGLVKKLIVNFVKDHLDRLKDGKFWLGLVVLVVSAILEQLELPPEQMKYAMMALAYLALRLGVEMETTKDLRAKRETRLETPKH